MKKIKPGNYDEFKKQFSVEIPENFNFAFDIIDEKCQSTPNETAMIHVDDQGASRVLDFEYFSKESSRLAHALVKKGVKKGDRIMIILYRRVDFWVTMLALHRVGAVAVPSPFLLTSKDIVYRVNFADIMGIIAEDSVADAVDEARDQCRTLQLFIKANLPVSGDGWESMTELCEGEDDLFPKPANPPSGDDPLLIFFSSGTTGPPKMVEHTHNYPLGHIVTASYWHDLNPGDIQLTLADTGWGKAVWGKFYGQWMAGAIVFVYDFRGKFEPANLLEVISKYKVSVFCAPPTVYRFLLQEPLENYDLSNLRHCTTAGELLNESVFDRWKEITGLSIYEGYGQTETTLLVATFPFMEPKPGSIGKPIPGWDIVLLDGDDNICPTDVEGEICVGISEKRPVGLFTGYVEQPEKTRIVTKNGYYRTGDKAWMDADGYYWFMGRVDDLIKSSGYRVGPFEVESALVSHDAVLEAAVTGVPDPVRGQAIKATIVLNAGFTASDDMAKELQEYVKSVTAPYKYPRIIDFVKELPKTLSGKIMRAKIRAEDIAQQK